MNLIEGNFQAQDLNVAIVAGRFNEFITSKLVGGATDCLLRHGLKESNLTLTWVPGAFEIPLIAQKLAESKRFHAVICLGAVIRGSTSHYDYVCNEVAKGVSQTALKSGVPTIFGVLTTDSIEQAIERAGTKAGNKGWESALAAIEMANITKEIERAGL